MHTKATQNIVEVVEIIVSLLQDCPVANGDVDLAIGISHSTGAG